MVDPHQVRLEVWKKAVMAAERQLDSCERCLKHPGNTPLDSMMSGIWRELTACHLDALKSTLRKIEGT